MEHGYIKAGKYFLILFGIMFLSAGSIAIITTQKLPPSKVIDTKYAKTAIFSMGCFLSSEPAFTNPNTKEKIPGVLSIRVGYSNGTGEDPADKNHEDYKKAIKIKYNPSIITYEQLLDIFWHNIDPFNEGGQFCNKGDAYAAAIFYLDDIQQEEALHSKKKIGFILNKKVVTPVLKAKNFHEADEKYQHFFNKNPIRYGYYQWQCSRDKPLKKIWGDISYVPQ